MKAGNIRKLDKNEIKNKLYELNKELFNLRFQKGIGQLENSAMLSKIKKDIARLKTVAREMNFEIN